MTHGAGAGGQPPTETVVGEVVRAPFAPGSKSARDAALMLVAGERRWRLRRRGAPSFGAEDADLAALEGCTVAVTGSPLATSFLVDSWEPVDPLAASPPG